MLCYAMLFGQGLPLRASPSHLMQSRGADGAGVKNWSVPIRRVVAVVLDRPFVPVIACLRVTRASLVRGSSPWPFQKAKSYFCELKKLRPWHYTVRPWHYTYYPVIAKTGPCALPGRFTPRKSQTSKLTPR